MSKNKIQIDGFRMHQAILKEFYLLRDESFSRPPASAYVVYLSLLKQLDLEKNQRGILKEFNLSEYARKLGISYSTLYSGKKWLEKHHFVAELIDSSGFPVLQLKDVEKYNIPEKGNNLNYLIIPHALFETNILAEFVRTSNPEAIELLFSLLNQFRTGLSKMENPKIQAVKQARTMKTLKKQLNKNSKGVRNILSIIEPLFEIKYEGINMKGHQVWINKVWISIKEECVKEESNEFKVDHLIAMLSHELTYFFDWHKIAFKPRDQKDVMISFKQEVINILKHFNDDKNIFDRDKFIKKYFIDCLDKIEEYIDINKKKFKSFKIKSIGAMFRMFFRKNLATALKKLPYEIVHDAKIKEYTLTGITPDRLAL